MASVLVLGATAVGAAACAQDGEDPDPRAELSAFAEDTLVTARVVENVTACEVDAVCYLRLAFADTTVTALYGTGERPAPPCDMSVEVSNAAWPLGEGDVVDIEVARCGPVGYYIRTLAPQAASE